MTRFRNTTTTIKKSDIDQFASQNPRIGEIQKIEDLVVSLQTVIEKVLEIQFGVRSGLISDTFIEEVMKDITKRFKTLTIEDISFSFERVVIEKKDWRNVTKPEFMKPVQEWWNYKEKIRLELNEFKKEQQREQESEQKNQEFKEKSIDIYRKSIVCAEWLGDIFHANAIARDVAEHIHKHKKNEIWQKAKKKKYLQDKAFKEDPEKVVFSNVGITAERIFGELIVIEGIKQKIRI